MRPLFFALLFVVALPFTSMAQETIAIVDMQEVMKESVAIQKIQDQIKDKRKEFQEDVQKKEEDLREDEKKLVEQRALLAKEAYESKARDLQERVNEINRGLQKKRIEYDKASKAAVDEVQQVIADIVNDLASEKKFKIALPSAVVLFYGNELDITAEVVTRLNKKLPKVKTKLP